MFQCLRAKIETYAKLINKSHQPREATLPVSDKKKKSYLKKDKLVTMSIKYINYIKEMSPSSLR